MPAWMNFTMHFDHLFEFKIEYKYGKEHLTSADPSVGVASISAIPIGAIPPVVVSPVAQSV